MTILYLDTSSSFLYTGIIKENKLLCEIKENLNKDLSSFALKEIEDMFKKNQMNPQDIDKILVVNGPGSFTGIRIGLTIAKIYAWALKKEVSTISSLEAMAISATYEYDYIIPCIDARRDYVYAAIFDANYNPILKEQYISLVALLTAADNLPGKVLFITKDVLKTTKYDVLDYDPNILKIVMKYSDRLSLNPHEIDAYYLKMTEAEENRHDS